jgi:small subunit ribosomal protein S18
MDRPMDNEMEQGGDRRYYARPKFCQFCADKHLAIDYKLADVLRRFVTDDGKIRPRRQTGTCAKHQRELAIAIKRARQIALLPFTGRAFDDDR